MSAPVFHWFLPTGGDDRVLGAQSHGAAIGGAGSGGRTGAGPPGHREPTLPYLTQLATAVEELGFTGVLTPTGAHCEEAWLVTAALLAQTRRLKFLVALRPGLMSPVLAAHFAATFQLLSRDRLMLNVVVGGDPVERRAYGDAAPDEQRYARATEFLEIVRRSLAGETVEHTGPHYAVEGARLRRPPAVLPEVYLGGSSAGAVETAAREADVFLTWGEPVDAVAAKVATVRRAAEDQGRRLRFGIRLHVITRDTATEAWADAERLIAGVDAATVRARQASLRRLTSVGQRRMLDLHGGDRDRLLVAPNLWAGIGLVRGGAGTALVGSHAEVAERIEEYRAVGIDEFILSGYPHLEEAYAVGEGVLPLVEQSRAG